MHPRHLNKCPLTVQQLKGYLFQPLAQMIHPGANLRVEIVALTGSSQLAQHIDDLRSWRFPTPSSSTSLTEEAY